MGSFLSSENTHFPPLCSLFLDEMFSSSYIHFDGPIKGGFSQECQPFLIEIGAKEMFDELLTFALSCS